MTPSCFNSLWQFVWVDSLIIGSPSLVKDTAGNWLIRQRKKKRSLLISIEPSSLLRYSKWFRTVRFLFNWSEYLKFCCLIAFQRHFLLGYSLLPYVTDRDRDYMRSWGIPAEADCSGQWLRQLCVQSRNIACWAGPRPQFGARKFG